MTASTPKQGDRVRCTLGESVVVGTFSRHFSDGSFSVLPDGAQNLRNIFGSAWTVEVLRPPVPDVEGTIVRDRFGTAWQRLAAGWRPVGGIRFGNDLDRYYFRSLGHIEMYYGPLEVARFDTEADQ
jgi:hypothetical protein